MRTNLALRSLWLPSLLLWAGSALAQHPIEVQRAAASGDYMAALTLYEKLPKRSMTAAAEIAAARSAWALSLPTRALEGYDRALKMGGLTDVDQARAFLAKGAIEFQEGRPQLALLHVEKAVTLLAEPSPLRSQVYALWGQALVALRSYALAEERYAEAIREAAPESRGELSFLLGSVQFTLGKYAEARQNLEQIPLRHERTPDAIRTLAKIALDTGNLKSAGFWVNKGRQEFPEQFLDSWVDYVSARAAIESHDISLLRRIRSDAEKRYAASDPWLNLLNAAAEEYEWQQSAPDLGQTISGGPA